MPYPTAFIRLPLINHEFNKDLIKTCNFEFSYLYTCTPLWVKCNQNMFNTPKTQCLSEWVFKAYDGFRISIVWAKIKHHKWKQKLNITSESLNRCCSICLCCSCWKLPIISNSFQSACWRCSTPKSEIQHFANPCNPLHFTLKLLVELS